ncbi:MAG: chemotaxis protein CheX [Vicinamibacterales bacterium]
MMPAAEHERIVEAVIRVAERSLYAFAEPVPPEIMPRTIDGGWYDATVRFCGPFSGALALAVPVVLARQICAAFLGDSEVDDETAIRDLVGEFANMACGTWLTAVNDAGCFDLARPEVTAAEALERRELAFVINELPVMLSARIDGTAA